jgi:hypothetical protein
MTALLIRIDKTGEQPVLMDDDDACVADEKDILWRWIAATATREEGRELLAAWLRDHRR